MGRSQWKTATGKPTGRKLPSHRQLGRGEPQVPEGRLGLGRGHEREVGNSAGIAEALIWAVSDLSCTSALLLSKQFF